MDLQEKVNLIKNNKAIAMLAPTFAIDFKYPNIIRMLKKFGFKEVTELTFGARMVNWAYENYIKENINQKFFISSPCPTIVALVKSQYPELTKYLVPVVSPMTAMAKICKKLNPKYKIIFISPCWAKELLEAPKYKEIDTVITLKDLKKILLDENIKEENFSENVCFDSLIREYTKIYPISGGLASTSHIQKFFKKKEILITDGIENIKKAFEEIKAGTSKYRFLDLLNCNGGCIGGPAINRQDLSIEKRKEIIHEYTHRSSDECMGKHKGKIKDAENINLNTQF